MSGLNCDIVTTSIRTHGCQVYKNPSQKAPDRFGVWRIANRLQRNRQLKKWSNGLLTPKPTDPVRLSTYCDWFMSDSTLFHDAIDDRLYRWLKEPRNVLAIRKLRHLHFDGHNNSPRQFELSGSNTNTRIGIPNSTKLYPRRLIFIPESQLCGLIKATDNIVNVFRIIEPRSFEFL